jgi:hypothetical protein
MDNANAFGLWLHQRWDTDGNLEPLYNLSQVFFLYLNIKTTCFK